MPWKLVILRHSLTERIVAGQSDAERALTPEGVEVAEAQALVMKRLGITPEVVITSTARRALATTEVVVQAAGWSQARVVRAPEIYNATVPTLMKLLAEHGGERTTLLVGHNPGLADLLWTLSPTTPTPDDGSSFPPASFAIIEIEAPNVEPGVSGPARLVRPGDA